jgi:8-oxo-dGTP pyrophosphatase MutT (NUDIX family)
MSFTVKSLLNNKINKKYNDKVFWYATEVVIKDDIVSIYINNNNLVTFDNIELNILKISKLTSIKQKNKYIMNNVLVSSGSFLFINNKLLVTQRDYLTTFDPGFWTTPAGRCDNNIYETAIKETIEEIEIIKDNKKYFPNISKIFFTDEKNILFYNAYFENKDISLKMYSIKLYLDGILIEECKSWMYYSEEVNTLEFRIPIFAKLSEKEFIFNNPEFNTDTGLKSIEELRKLEVVPALKKLLEEL